MPDRHVLQCWRGRVSQGGGAYGDPSGILSNVRKCEKTSVSGCRAALISW